MKKLLIAGALIAPMISFAELEGDIPNAKHAWSVHDQNRPKPSRVVVNEKGIPSDAIVLFDGTQESLDANWSDEKGGKTKWTIKNGGFSSEDAWGLGSIRTKQEFGDCQLHIEYRHPENAKTVVPGNAQMRGNSGIFLMGCSYGYELQVLESYFTCKELEGKPEFIQNYADGQAGSVYAENPPLVNPQRKPGEWQVYDIVFHQPVWDGLRLVHPGSITLFFNGVLVQDHWEMEGQTTHSYRRPLQPHPVKGPLMLQDHGCEVAYRNIWLRPLKSRWDNKTHSNLSGDENAVMAERRATAARLFNKIADKKAATAKNVKDLAEVVSYVNEAPYREAFLEALKAYRPLAEKDDKKTIDSVNYVLGFLVRGGVIKESDLIK